MSQRTEEFYKASARNVIRMNLINRLNNYDVEKYFTQFPEGFDASEIQKVMSYIKGDQEFEIIWPDFPDVNASTQTSNDQAGR